MNKKDIVYSIVGGLASTVVIISLFANIDNKNLIDEKDLELPKGGVAYISMNDDFEEIDGYRVSIGEMESRITRGNPNIMKYSIASNKPDINKDMDTDSFNSPIQESYISEHNKKYSNLNNGVILGYNKGNGQEEEVNIASSIANHSKYLRLPLDSQYMHRTSAFGVRKDPIELSENDNKSTSSLPFHTGLDLSAEGILNKPIFAVSHGQIKRIQKSNQGYGNLVIVDHGNGFETYYAHMSEIDKDIQEGDLISVGTILGKVGSTGRSTGPHLHFEVNVNGVAIDPEVIIKLIGTNDLDRFIGEDVNNLFNKDSETEKVEVIIEENVGGKFTPLKFRVK